MKQFIVLAAVLPILMIFVMQFSLEQKNHQALSEVQKIVNSEAHEARKTGLFSDESVDRMKTGIARVLAVEFSDVTFECYISTEHITPENDDEGYEGDGRRLTYTVKAPINKVIAGNRLVGIPDERNRTWYEIKGGIPLSHLRGPEGNDDNADNPDRDDDSVNNSGPDDNADDSERGSNNTENSERDGDNADNSDSDDDHANNSD